MRTLTKSTVGPSFSYLMRFSDPALSNFVTLQHLTRDTKYVLAPLVLPAYKSPAPLGEILAPAVDGSGKDFYSSLGGKESSLEASDLWKYPYKSSLSTHPHA